MKSDAKDSTTWMLPEELCKYLRISKKALYEMTHKRTIPFAMVGNRLRFNKREIDQWMEQKCIRG